MADSIFQVKTSVEIFPDKIDQLFNTPTGPVGLAVEHAANVILAGARGRIGDTYSGHHPGPRLRDTGKVESIGGAAHAVVFDHPIAFLHHEGASAHGITPHRPSGMGRNGPGIVTSWGATRFWTKRSVAHPGFDGNPYLRDSADDAGLRSSGTLLRGTRPTSLFRLRQL